MNGAAEQPLRFGMCAAYFSDRERGPRPRVLEEITPAAWGGIVSRVRTLIDNGAFGAAFPENCSDSPVPIGTNEGAMSRSLQAEVPGIAWPLDAANPPTRLTALDFLEFCHRNVARPDQVEFHRPLSHHHLAFDKDAGQAEFREAINLIFSRNGLAYELQDDGQIVRLAPSILRESLASAIFDTGDAELNSMLETARTKYLDPKPEVRLEALEKLWDAWERVKTLELGGKKISTKAILDNAASERNFRDVLEKEAQALTAIGNQFQIRHSETDQVPLKRNEHVDYLFHRLFAMIQLLLRSQ